MTNDSLALTFESTISDDTIENSLRELRDHNVDDMRPAVDEEALDGLKFSECLPRETAIRMLETRLADPEALCRVLNQRTRFVAGERSVGSGLEDLLLADAYGA